MKNRFFLFMLFLTFLINVSPLFPEIQKIILDTGNYRWITIPNSEYFPDTQIIATKDYDIVRFDGNSNSSIITSIPTEYRDPDYGFQIFPIVSYNDGFVFGRGIRPYSSRGIYTISQNGVVQVVNASNFDSILGIRIGPSGFGDFQDDIFVVERGNNCVTTGADFGAIVGIVRITPQGEKTQFYDGGTSPFKLYDGIDSRFSPNSFGNYGNLLFVLDNTDYCPHDQRILMIYPDQSADVFFNLYNFGNPGDVGQIVAMAFNPLSPEIYIASYTKIYKIYLDGSFEIFDQDYVQIRDISFNQHGDLFISDVGAQILYKIVINQSPVPNAGENISIASEDISITNIQGTATDGDTNDTLQYRWKEGDYALLNWATVGVNGECILYSTSLPVGIGTHTLTLEVTDGKITASDDMILTIDNSIPHLAPTGSGVYEVFTDVTLGGEVSDFDGDTLNFQWLENSNVLNSGMIQTLVGGIPIDLPSYIMSNLDLGIHNITLQVDDGINPPQISNITIEIVDTNVPTIAPTANNTILWPPNQKMVDIIIEANASDNSGEPVTLSATVSSNEPVNGTSDGDIDQDWSTPIIDQNSGIITLQLRAERSGSGNGRVYTVTITATDNSNNSSTTNIEIIVPHDKGKK